MARKLWRGKMVCFEVTFEGVNCLFKFVKFGKHTDKTSKINNDV